MSQKALKKSHLELSLATEQLGRKRRPNPHILCNCADPRVRRPKPMLFRLEHLLVYLGSLDRVTKGKVDNHAQPQQSTLLLTSPGSEAQPHNDTKKGA